MVSLQLQHDQVADAGRDGGDSRPRETHVGRRPGWGGHPHAHQPYLGHQDQVTEYTNKIDANVDQLLQCIKFNVILGTTPLF